MTKDEAIVKILKVLKSPMAAVCKPRTDEVLTLAKEYGITVSEVIEAWMNISMRT